MFSEKGLDLMRQWYNVNGCFNPEDLNEEDKVLMGISDGVNRVTITTQEYDELLEYRSMYEQLLK